MLTYVSMKKMNTMRKVVRNFEKNLLYDLNPRTSATADDWLNCNQWKVFKYDLLSSLSYKYHKSLEKNRSVFAEASVVKIKE